MRAMGCLVSAPLVGLRRWLGLCAVGGQPCAQTLTHPLLPVFIDGCCQALDASQTLFFFPQHTYLLSVAFLCFFKGLHPCPQNRAISGLEICFSR